MIEWFTRVGETFPRSVSEAFPGELEARGLVPCMSIFDSIDGATKQTLVSQVPADHDEAFALVGTVKDGKAEAQAVFMKKLGNGWRFDAMGGIKTDAKLEAGVALVWSGKSD